MAQVTQPHEVRAALREALELDLIGPGAGHALAHERLPGWVRPSNWYLAGFLAPRDTPTEQRADADSDDDFQSQMADDKGPDDDSTEDRTAARKSFFPSSMGLSFLVAEGVESLDVTVRWGDYRHADAEVAPDEGAPDGGGDGSVATPPVSTDPERQGAAPAVQGSQASSWWQRTPREEVVPVVLPPAGELRATPVPGSHGLTLRVVARPVDSASFAGRIAPGTRSVSLFLVNERTAVERLDEAFAFQTEIEVSAAIPFVPRPDPRPMAWGDWDERVADLHYADAPEYAAGHGVAADWELVDGGCRRVRTTWTPSAEVEKTDTFDPLGVELAMDVLGGLADGAAVETALAPLATSFRSWIEDQRRGLADLAGERREVAEELLRLAAHAAGRIERGIWLLARDEDALDAFRVANRAVSAALSRRLARAGVDEKPRWRAFQLAFLLLNLPGLVDPADADREIVDLLFFPTGGGKTEAYLGLAAFTMVLRRLRNPDVEGRAGAGVSVIMRYTLRLLTLDQLGRAAGLVCALELERRKDAARYGAWPFEIGLWVGKAGTPNQLGRKGDGRSDSARSLVNQYKNDSSRRSPIPLESCPWCGKEFNANSFSLLPDSDHPTDLRIVCADWQCDFTGDTPLPVVAVDEPLYRRLPAFLIATVDKFASLPWVGPSGALLGGAERYDSNGFYGAAEPGRGRRLDRPLLPPDLVIQDELHLISGPLGTMAGLYEAVIETLCQRETDGKRVKPKIVASTATVRRASEQIQALFGRPTTQIFPPAGPTRRDSFFAVTRPASERSGRQYFGVAAQGRNPKEMMRRVLLALMGAAERAWRDAGGPRHQDNPADAYMTVLGYFNSLRELGGARRILEEEVQNTLKRYGDRKRLGEAQGLFRDRTSFADVVELTSRVSTDRVTLARRLLQEPFANRERRVDCAIATNMISVGLDIQRLGLMMVYGQPKTHSEYIQATSRVGRDDRRPGLVVTLYNVHRPRDRSHYERFRHYHETFYRSVEVTSVTPFAARALDHGFAGALVALARHARGAMTPAAGVEAIATERAALEGLLLDAFRERINRQPLQDEDERNQRLRSVQDRIGDLLDSWRKIHGDYDSVGAPMQYQQYEVRNRKPLLREMLDTEFDTPHHEKFRVNRSLRDVEPQVNLYLKDLSGRLSGGGA